MKRRTAILCCEAILIGALISNWALAQEKDAQEAAEPNRALHIDEENRPSVDRLRALAETIKACPRALISETKWGKGALDIERWYEGPPQNVIWDVKASSSVRSPYSGCIDFTLTEQHWVPEETKEKFERSSAATAYVLATSSGTGVMQYRYEFDVSPEGLELAKMLRCAPNPKKNFQTECVYFDTAKEEQTCWQKAAQSAALTKPQAKE